jgi:hypothetical protein
MADMQKKSTILKTDCAAAASSSTVVHVVVFLDDLVSSHLV